jgi:hypothetical protein
MGTATINVAINLCLKRSGGDSRVAHLLIIECEADDVVFVIRSKTSIDGNVGEAAIGIVASELKVRGGAPDCASGGSFQSARARSLGNAASG